MVLITKATDNLKQYSGCWCSWIGCGLPGHGNILILKIGKAHIKNQEKISKIWTLHKLKIAWKINPAMFALVLVNNSISTSVLSCYFALNMQSLKGGHPMGSISSFIPWGRGEAAWIPKRSSLQVAMWGCWSPSAPCCPTLWRQLAAFLEFQPKLVGGAWQVLAIQAHSSLTDSSLWEERRWAAAGGPD